jgi:hypothetical protein
MYQEEIRLLREVREEVVQLLFNRYVFRTHQEIVRQNPRLQGRPRSIFAEWAQITYAVANTVAVRRLASSAYQDGDVNLVRLLDMFMRDPTKLWACFERYYPNHAVAARAKVVNKVAAGESGWETLACKRLLGEDRKQLINAAEKANRFASKRAAHSAPHVPVHTTFSDLDEAIDTIKKLAEKYTQLACAERRQALESLYRAGKPTLYREFVQMEKNLDLLQEMKRRKLSSGWDSIFLEAWATKKTLSLPLGDTQPPRRAG